MAQYRITVEETFSWQGPIISIINDAPSDPSKGDRYIVGTPTEEDPFETHDKSIAWFNGTAWVFDVPEEGWIVYNIQTKRTIQFDGDNWINPPVILEVLEEDPVSPAVGQMWIVEDEEE